VEQTPEIITRFEDLKDVGVHRNIVNTITQDMRFESMTDVQSLTVNPALEGKDM
jgi:ATP-dependent RNA helicase MSS116